MAPKRRASRSHCPINFGLEIFGDSWTLLVIRDALFFGKRRFRDFVESDEKIATNILSDRLQRLVTGGLLRRTDGGNGGPCYLPTKKAVDLLPMLVEMVLWSVQYDSETAAPPEFIRAAKKDRAGLLRKITANVGAGKPGFHVPGKKDE